MTSSRLLVIALAPALVAGCYINDAAPAATYPQQPQVYYGPPGGGMDPSYAPQGPGYSAAAPQYNTDGEANSAPQSYDDGTDQAYADGSVDPSVEADPSAQVVDPDGPTGPVTDTEIDTTLDGYGSWDEDADYGRVWRPDATVVGADFTPYESCGTWMWTDYGWTFSCDWDWGWLPFHYGNWVWCDDGYWGWVPGHSWSPAWVDWRYGGGYVGWRPHGPHIRDHRHPEHDHASQWRFSRVADFSRPHIRSHLYRDPAEGLRVTQPVRHPQLVHPAMPTVKAAALMRARFANPTFTRGGGPSLAGGAGQPMPVRPGRPAPIGDRQDEVTWRPHPTYTQPTWQRPAGNPAMTGYRPPAQGYRPPAEGYRPPVQTYRPPVQTYRPPVQTYRPPVYTPPSGGFHPAGGGGFHPSGGGGFHPSGGGGGFHPSGGGGFHPSGGGGMHFGGGGRHR